MRSMTLATILAIQGTMAAIAHEVQIDDGDKRPYSCNEAMELWNGWWTFSYHDAHGRIYEDYPLTLRRFETRGEALRQMALTVYNLNK